MEYPRPRLSQHTAALDVQQKATALLAWALSSDSRLAADPILAMRARGHGRFLSQQKSAIDAVATTDEGVALLPLRTAFLGLVDRESLIGRLEGAVRVPINAAARLQVGSVSAVEVAEGAVKPVMRLDFASPPAPTKVEAQIVISSEALLSLDPATQDGVRAILVSATAAASDVALIDALTTGSPNASSAVGDLFAAISDGAPRRPYLIGGFDSLLALPVGTVRDLEALGVVVLSTPAAAGYLIAVDAAGVLISDDGEAVVATARHADLLLDDGSSPAGTTIVNLWQSNLSAIRAERRLRIAVRDGAAAFASVGSPS